MMLPAMKPYLSIYACSWDFLHFRMFRSVTGCASDRRTRKYRRDAEFQRFFLSVRRYPQPACRYSR
jgi:hypothetical protein